MQKFSCAFNSLTERNTSGYAAINLMKNLVNEFTRNVYIAAKNLGLPDSQARLAATQASLETTYGKSVKIGNPARKQQSNLLENSPLRVPRMIVSAGFGRGFRANFN